MKFLRFSIGALMGVVFSWRSGSPPSVRQRCSGRVRPSRSTPVILSVTAFVATCAARGPSRLPSLGFATVRMDLLPDDVLALAGKQRRDRPRHTCPSC